MFNFIKRRVLTLVFFLSAVSGSFLFATEIKPFSLWGSGEVFKLDPVIDSVLLGSGTAIYGTEIILSKGFHVNQKTFDGDSLKLSDVNFFDRKLAHQYNHTVDKISDAVLISTFALPLTLGLTDKSEWATAFVMYAETMLLAQGIKESVKLAVHRPRPYMYFEGFPEKDVYDENDWANSFLSGHSTMSFAAVTFTSYTFCKYFPDNPWKYAVVFGSYAMASSVAVMRVFAGCHFPTDVLCGAVLGTVTGFVVPWLHTLNTGKKDNMEVSALPLGMMMTFRFK